MFNLFTTLIGILSNIGDIKKADMRETHIDIDVVDKDGNKYNLWLRKEGNENA